MLVVRGKRGVNAEIIKTATGLKEMSSPVLMAKIDCEGFSKVASQLEIKGFPTLLLFVKPHWSDQFDSVV